MAEEDALNERVAKIAAEAEVQALAIQLRERVDELDLVNEVLNQPVGGWAVSKPTDGWLGGLQTKSWLWGAYGPQA